MESGNVNGEHASKSETSEVHISIIIVVCVISFFILAGNLLTIVSISLFTKRKNTFSLIITALSLTDVLNVFGPNGIALYVSIDKENNFFHKLFTLCRVQAWTIVFLRIAATLIITLLSLDRAFITVLPRFYHRHWKGKLLVAFFFGMWIIAALIATWPLLWLDGFHVSKDTQGLFCLFEYKNPFGGFFVLFLVFTVVICCFCFCVTFGAANKKSFSTKLTIEEDLCSSKQHAIVGRDVHPSTKELSRMAALVVAIYFCCILPWMVAITLGIFSVDYPPLYGLFAFQLPMISSLLNPLIYGITWPPCRRAYIRTLRWPCVRCCKRKFKRCSRAMSHNLNSSTSASHSFWISDSFAEEDADHENAFHILFGPTTYIKPLDFNQEELEMFEKDTKNICSSKPKRSFTGHANAKGTAYHEHGNHFQNILDFIDEMTEGKTRNVCVTGIKANTSAPSQRSADNTSPLSRRHCNDLELSFRHQSSFEISGAKQCGEHRKEAGCYCLGKSKCYVVDRKRREVDLLVSKERESISSGETLTTDI